MVTKPILKNQNFDDKFVLANRLDTIADRVIKRGVLVVDKNANGYYNLIDYFNKNILVQDIPNLAIAKSLCNSLNTKKVNKKKSYDDLAAILEQYHKLNNDCMFYRNTIKVSKDPFRVEVALTRLDISLLKLKSVHHLMQAFL